MTSSTTLGLYVMSAKGLAVLERILELFGAAFIAYVMTARDEAVEKDYYEEIVRVARNAGLRIYDRSESSTVPENVSYLYAVSWRWLIPTKLPQRLVVFHDSILPRYRGFAPVVAALINGDSCLGVTALLASSEYDRGPIIAQKTIPVTYPLKIATAIERLTECYQDLATEVASKIISSELTYTTQDESLATYSSWRDAHDYFIDWTWSSARIRRFVDAVGFPYLGAATVADGIIYRIVECSIAEDVVIENRIPGKVIFVLENKPIVVCGEGLLRIHQMVDARERKSVLPLKHFRTCFHTPPRI